MSKKKELERILFAANDAGQLLPMFAQGKFSEIEVAEFSLERNWSDSVPEPPGIGMWVWEYHPSGGDRDYWGEYDDIYIDQGSWRPLNSCEWYCLQRGECPWIPVIKEDAAMEFNLELT